MHEKIEKLRGLKLLFVEDEEDLLSIISDALTKLEANFVTASNGQMLQQGAFEIQGGNNTHQIDLTYECGIANGSLLGQVADYYTVNVEIILIPDF
jgi:hypothetical protein